MLVRNLCLTVLWICLAISPVQASESDRVWSATYDDYFRKYSGRYFGPFLDWRWFKCQAIAESGLDPEAQSRVGALGLMQILPSTFDEIQNARPHFNDIDEPKWNIAAGVYYTRMLYEQWAHYDEAERIKFTFASYNAGLHRVRKAIKRTPGSTKSWKKVSPYLPRQTRHYVKRILQIKGTSTTSGH